MQKNFAEKSKGLFRQIMLMIAGVSGLLLFLFFKIYQKIYLYAGILIHKITTACDCTQMSQLFSMHPFIFGSLVALSILIISFISRAVYKLIKLIIQTRKFSTQYLIRVKLQHSAKLRQVIADLHLDKNRIMEVRDAKPIVFCYGLWQSKVCISNGLIKILQRDELEAVLLHEASHMFAKEPLKLFIIKLFYSIFFFLPGLKTYVNKYATFSELAADECATDNFTDRAKLARAIFKISQVEEKHALRSGLALSFFTSTIAERVNKLSDNDYMPKFRVWGRGFLFGLCSVVFTISLIIVLLADSTKAFAMHDYGGCSAASTQDRAIVSACDNSKADQQNCGQNSVFGQTAAN